MKWSECLLELESQNRRLESAFRELRDGVATRVEEFPPEMLEELCESLGSLARSGRMPREGGLR